MGAGISSVALRARLHDRPRAAAAALSALLAVAFIAAGMAVASAEPAPSAPSAPRDVTATPGASSAQVSWSPPEEEGGSPIAHYVITALPSGRAANPAPKFVKATAATSFRMTGLTPGVSYSFLVAAKNTDIAEYSSYSSASAAVRLARPPQALTLTDLTGGARSVAMAWTAPVSDAPVTRYVIRATATKPDGSPVVVIRTVTGTGAEAPPTSATVTGLTPGFTYRFTVAAESSGGAGPASAPSDPVTMPRLPAEPVITTISAPTATSLAVAWAEPQSDLPITRYTVVATATRPNGSQHKVTKTVTGSPPATSITVTGLTAGLTYVASVSATSEVGAGLASRPRGVASDASPAPWTGPSKVLSTSANHGCAVTGLATVRCWGGAGLLGNGTTTPSATPVTVDGIDDATAVATGFGHTCALRSAGTVACWGSNGNGQLGNGSTAVAHSPVPVSNLTAAVSIAVGETFSCAATAAGTVWCWGSNESGQLGNGTSGGSTRSSIPVQVTELGNAVSVTAGRQHACALLADGTGRCWGLNANGQLGNGNGTTSAVPVAVSGLAGARTMAAGTTRTCALLDSRAVSCWGGTVPNSSVSVPVLIGGITTADRLDVGALHTCARLADRTARCWGENLDGQLGNASVPIATLAPVPVEGLSGVTDVSAGGNRTCLVTAAGTVHCVGTGHGGWEWPTPVLVSGFGPAVDRAPVLRLPHPVGRATDDAGGPVSFTTSAADDVDGTVPVDCSADPGDTFAVGATAVSCTATDSAGHTATGSFTVTVIRPERVSVDGGSGRSCAISEAATVWCWSTSGGSVGTPRLVAGEVPGLAGIVSVAVGSNHQCALDDTQRVWCGGSNVWGQLGTGDTEPRAAPVEVVGVGSARSLSVHSHVSCAVRTDGTVWCWGGGQPQLRQIGDITDGVMVSTGNNHTCVLREGGSVQCFGEAAGTWITEGAVSVTSGNRHSCALLETGLVRCWGYSTLGQVPGRPTPIFPGGSSPSPVSNTANGTRDAVGVASNGDHTCLVTATGATRCWGHAEHGKLWNGVTNVSNIQSLAHDVVGLGPSAAVATGPTHSCALLRTGAPRCWGLLGTTASGPTAVGNWPDS